MEDAIRRSCLENTVKSLRVPQRLLQYDVCRIGRIDGLTTSYRPNFDAPATKLIDKVPSNKPTAAGNNGFTHGLKMSRDFPQTFSGRARSHLAAQYRAKRNRHGSRSRCRCWLLYSAEGLACRDN